MQPNSPRTRWVKRSIPLQSYYQEQIVTIHHMWEVGLTVSGGKRLLHRSAPQINSWRHFPSSFSFLRRYKKVIIREKGGESIGWSGEVKVSAWWTGEGATGGCHWRGSWCEHRRLPEESLFLLLTASFKHFYIAVKFVSIMAEETAVRPPDLSLPKHSSLTGNLWQRMIITVGQKPDWSDENIP